MANYIIKNGELYHAHGLSNTNSSSKSGSKTIYKNKVRDMLRKHVAIQEHRALTDFNIKGMAIDGIHDIVYYTVQYYDQYNNKYKNDRSKNVKLSYLFKKYS